MKKKLIEVALPLEAINAASAREKSIRHGHPSTLHLWWARRPLAACRAVLFASLVDDPSSHPDRFPTEEAQEKERQRLFRLIEELVKWENSNNEEVLARARKEILDSTGGNPPPVYDPFCGGGSIPLEAQRLGLEAHASDLNPVAVVITKAMIEIPPKFQDHRPVHPNTEAELIAKEWKRNEGLVEDIRYYGQWMREEAWRRIGYLYPKVKLPEAQGGGEATVIAWLWARTVSCPNPGCGAVVPLSRSFELSKRGSNRAWVEPIVDRTVHPARVGFEIRSGSGRAPQGSLVRHGAKCLACGSPIPLSHVKYQGAQAGLGVRLMAIVAEGPLGRLYLRPTEEQVEVSQQATPEWSPETDLSTHPQYMGTPRYGLTGHADLFTLRQLAAMSTFSGLAGAVFDRIHADAGRAGMSGDERGLQEGGVGARAYAEGVCTYLAFLVSKLADISNCLCAWEPLAQCPRHLFARQAIPMVWDFAEGNPFSASSGSWDVLVRNMLNSLLSPAFSFSRVSSGQVSMSDSTKDSPRIGPVLYSTDPPYYDNVPYADLSDFFYVWLRRSLGAVYKGYFDTMLVPKSSELVADVTRFNGDKQEAKVFFETGLQNAFAQVIEQHDADYPLTVYYAFKQVETKPKDHGGIDQAASTGWETMLSALLRSGFSVCGTWPLRTEAGNRMRGQNSNVLASSIVLACRKRPQKLTTITRREFINTLKQDLPQALRNLQKENIAPVDLAQSAIGPGMAVFSRYARVLEADGSEMSVRMALSLINQALDEVLAEQEGYFDPETRFAVVTAHII